MDIWQLFAGKKRGIQEAPLKGDKKECKLTWNDISHTNGLYQKGEPQKVKKCYKRDMIYELSATTSG